MICRDYAMFETEMQRMPLKNFVSDAVPRMKPIMSVKKQNYNFSI